MTDSESMRRYKLHRNIMAAITVVIVTLSALAGYLHGR